MVNTIGAQFIDRSGKLDSQHFVVLRISVYAVVICLKLT